MDHSRTPEVPPAETFVSADQMSPSVQPDPTRLLQRASQYLCFSDLKARSALSCSSITLPGDVVRSVFSGVFDLTRCWPGCV